MGIELPPLTYGVWINGKGWLKDKSGRHFADLRIEYAEEVIDFLLDTPARVALIDESMMALEDLFLEKENQQALELLRKVSQKKSLSVIMRTLAHELLGSSRTNSG